MPSVVYHAYSVVYLKPFVVYYKSSISIFCRLYPTFFVVYYFLSIVYHMPSVVFTHTFCRSPLTTHLLTSTLCKSSDVYSTSFVVRHTPSRLSHTFRRQFKIQRIMLPRKLSISTCELNLIIFATAQMRRAVGREKWRGK